MIKRTYSKFTKPDGREAWSVTVNQEGGEIIAAFLYSDVSAFGGAMREEFMRVLAGERATGEMTGNACHVCITPQQTRIVNMLSMGPEEAAVTVDSRDLLELMDEWMAMLEKQE